MDSGDIPPDSQGPLLVLCSLSQPWCFQSWPKQLWISLEGRLPALGTTLHPGEHGSGRLSQWLTGEGYKGHLLAWSWGKLSERIYIPILACRIGLELVLCLKVYVVCMLFGFPLLLVLLLPLLYCFLLRSLPLMKSPASQPSSQGLLLGEPDVRCQETFVEWMKGLYLNTCSREGQMKHTSWLKGSCSFLFSVDQWVPFYFYTVVKMFTKTKVIQKILGWCNSNCSLEG